MLLGRILGSAVCTIKHPDLVGVKLLTVQPLNKKLEPVGSVQVAADVVHAGPGDLVVNVCKKRHVTNVRSSYKEIDDRLTPPRDMSLDECIEYLRDDELLEVTPKSLRLRKRILDSRTRGREEKRAKEAMGV